MKVILSLLIVLSSSISLYAQSWSQVGTLTEYTDLNYCDQIQTMALSATGAPYMLSYCSSGAASAIRVSKWEGTYWNGFTKPGANGTLRTMAIDANSNVYVAGAMKDANNKFYVKKWNGTAWSSVGAGTNALAVNNIINILTLDGSGNLYAAGNFTDANGKLYVAKWDGTTWSALGSLNVSGSITSMVIDNSGNIYVTGTFKDSYNNYYVAKWNGTQWLELGLDTNNKVLIGNAPSLTLALDNSQTLYAAGQFYDPTTFQYYVAKWDGSAWSAVGTMYTSQYILSLASDLSGNVYASGLFRDVLGNYSVMKWDGATWSQLGEPGDPLLHSGLFALATDQENNVFVVVGYHDASQRNVIAKYTNTVTSSTHATASRSLSVFPNPSKDVFSLILSEEGKVSLYNSVGKLIHDHQGTKGVYKIDLSAFPQGVYTLVFNGQGALYTPVKLVKE
ncbi:MAG: hypothetical protein K0R51_1098 [Cytophagaceae bacterium]|jgi:hypothetical protein|nr:hypothetical protein [Cytophagaceae bacterium]